MGEEHNQTVGEVTAPAKKPRSHRAGLWRLALLLVVLAVGYWWLTQGNICGLPLKYRLGHLDERFGLTRQQATDAIMQAEARWESSVGANLFEFDQTAEYAVVVNFVFDDRQAAVYELDDLKTERQELEGDLSEILNEYRDLKDNFDRQAKLIEQMHANYQERFRQFEQKVEVWNQRGGAPPQVYEELQNEQAELDRQAAELNDLIDKQNALAARINELAEAENQTVEGYNQGVKQFNETYVAEEGTDLEQGIYSSRVINVYQFENQADLEELLAHEMGHALGLDHTYNETDLMYPKKNERAATGDVKISTVSIDSLQTRCNLK
jgi:DNA repair exonuclease SbcCD ATPase subunit